MPVIVLVNDDYMEDQDMIETMSLPISDDLIFMRYIDGGECENPGESSDHRFFNSEEEEIIHGFVFYYPSINMCKIVEVCVNGAKDLADL